MIERRWRTVVASMALVTATAWLAAAQSPPPARRAAGAPPTPTPRPAVATVGPLHITQLELDQRTEQAVSQYKGQSGGTLPPEIMVVVRRQILEGLVRRDLLMLEARRRGLVASEQEAMAELRRDPYFQANGQFDSARFNQFRMTNPDLVQNALGEMRANLGARKLMQQLEREKGPAPGPLHARAQRALTRASMDYLALRRSDFDGNYPEPRESEVSAYYAEHPPEFQRPRRATLSIVFVDQPPLADSLSGDAKAVAAWNARTRQSADSLLAAARGGARLETISVEQGGVRSDQDVTPGNFPAFWKGDRATTESVFSARDSSLLPAVVPAEHGWLVVRVDHNEPARLASLREVATEIRSKLRNERRRNHEDRELRALYDEVRDSLKTTAVRLRYALADTAAFAVPAPAAAELERYYRAHLADYSKFSSKEGGVQSKSLDEVRDDVRRRWTAERRVELARAAAEQLRGSWGGGRRDAALERRLGAREAGPILPGVPVDTSRAGRVLADTLARRQGAPGGGLARTERGWIVFQVTERIPDWVPDFAQARPVLVRRLEARRERANEEGARRLFDADPARFAAGNVIHFSRMMVQAPNLLEVPLDREEVERYYREHLDKYSAPELVAARHILISPRDNTAQADKEAKARADSILARLRDGEDFTEVASKTTDDPATRGEGGDLGVFGRGSMLPEFERAVFAMRAGDLSETPVRTQVGYHIIKVYHYDPMVTNPLREVYANVSSDAAEAKADSLGRMLADSLVRVLRTPAQAQAAARRLRLRVLHFDHPAGKSEAGPDEMRAYFQRIESLKPGQLDRRTQKFHGMGYAVSWVDSLSPPRPPTWDEAHDQALETYRREAGLRAVAAKRAELDSLLRAGWSFDSIGVAWGGLLHAEEYAPGGRLVGVGTSARVDSAVFGTKGNDGMRSGQLGDWIELPGGSLRIRLERLHPPSASAVTARVQNDTRMETERALAGYFDTLKKRYPVRILEAKLRQVQLPKPPTSAP